MLVFPKLIFGLFHIFTLASAAHAQWPKHLPPIKAIEHAAMAVMAATDELPAELIMAVARVETGFRPERLSWKDGRTGKRVTGMWYSRSRGASFVAPYFCGNLQARASSWTDCLALRDVTRGYARGVIELTRWMRYCHGDERCALAGHGGGWNATRRVRAEARRDWSIKSKVKPPYWHRVLAWRDLLAKRLASSTAVW